MSCAISSLYSNRIAVYHPIVKAKSTKTKHDVRITCSSSNPNLLSHFKTLKKAARVPFSAMLSGMPHLANIIDPPVPTSVDPDHVFSGNFAPVDEQDPTLCSVIEGKIPPSLNGVYIRNGPNPKHKPSRALHLSEADGMLHSLQISNGRATYCSRYVKTYKYKLEEKAASPVIPNFLTGIYSLLDTLRLFAYLMKNISGNVNLMNGFGVANTNLALIGNKLLALYEADLPYIMKLTEEGDIETVGRWEFQKKLFSSLTAHPKFDMETGETFAFIRYDPVFSPHISFFRFDEDGVNTKEVPILSLKKAYFIHDFSITKKFAIFPETQFVLHPIKMTMGGGKPVEHDPNHTPRIGVIPKYAKSDSETKWFDVLGLNVLHVVNAWESEENKDEIVLVASNIVTTKNLYEKWVQFSIDKIKINMKTGNVFRQTLSPRNLEFGTINSSYTGKKNRFAYFGIVDELAKLSGVVKLDLETGEEIGSRFYGEGCFGGEPFFVPRETEGGEFDEDDGYVMTYVHDEKTGESKFLVMDAKSPELSVVAAIRPPRRVPYGFHGLFVSKKRLSSVF